MSSRPSPGGPVAYMGAEANGPSNGTSASAGAADELGLPGSGLEVHAAQRAAARARVVVLHELGLDAELLPHVRAEGLDEEAALVAVDCGLEQQDAFEADREGAHGGGEGSR